MPSAGDADGLGVAIDPTSSWIASSTTKGGVVVPGLEVSSLTGNGAPYRLPTCRTSSFTWGAYLAVRCLDRSSLEIWSPQERRRVRAIKADSITGIAAAASPDGRLVVQCREVLAKVPPAKKSETRGTTKKASKATGRLTPARRTGCESSAPSPWPAASRTWRRGARRPEVELDRVSSISKLHEVALNTAGDRVALTVFAPRSMPSAEMTMWNLTDGERVRIPHEVYGVKQMIWSPDGHRLAASSTDKTVRIWSDSGEQLEELGGER